MKSLKGTSVAIVGAGVSSLVADYRLRKAGAQATLVEGNNHGYFELLYQFRNNRNMNQPLFYAGHFCSSGIEGATLNGTNASKNVRRHLTRAAANPESPKQHKEEIL